MSRGMLRNVATGLEVNPSDIRLNGAYLLQLVGLNPNGFFCLSASKTGAGAGATIQPIAMGSGATKNLGDPLTVVTGTPVLFDAEFSLVGQRAIVVTGLNQTDDVLSVRFDQ